MEVTAPYRDMKMRRTEYFDFKHQQFLDRRRLWIRDPIACFFASVALAGAAAMQRTTLSSLDMAFELLAAGNEAIDQLRHCGVWLRP